jgi:magnesium transporter
VLTILGDSADVARSSSLPELPPDVIWIDLLNPTKEETTFVESRAKVRIPSIEMLSEIETSSRLAVDHGVVYLSIPAVAQGDTADAYLSPTGFILTKSVLVTIRFAPLSTFNAITEQVRQDETLRSSTAVFTALLEAMVDRGADVLERLGAELNTGDLEKWSSLVRNSRFAHNDSVLFSVRFRAVHPKDAGDCRPVQFFEVPHSLKIRFSW